MEVLNRMKILAGEGMINLAETNEKMFADAAASTEPPPATGSIEASGMVNRSAA